MQFTVINSAMVFTTDILSHSVHPPKRTIAFVRNGSLTGTEIRRPSIDCSHKEAGRRSTSDAADGTSAEGPARWSTCLAYAVVRAQRPVSCAVVQHFDHRCRCVHHHGRVDVRSIGHTTEVFVHREVVVDG